jgi:hypothetical protein
MTSMFKEKLNSFKNEVDYIFNEHNLENILFEFHYVDPFWDIENVKSMASMFEDNSFKDEVDYIFNEHYPENILFKFHRDLSTWNVNTCSKFNFNLLFT